MTEKSQGTCINVLEALLGRLKKTSPFVKRKTLRCMKHLLLQGNSAAFRAALLPHADSDLRPCIAASGPPDPLFGDEPFASVRREAAELLDALYRPVPAAATASGPTASFVTLAPVTAIAGPDVVPSSPSLQASASPGRSLLESVRSKLASLASSPQDRSTSNYGLPPSTLPTIPGLYTAAASSTTATQRQPPVMPPASSTQQAIEAEVLSETSGRDTPTQEELAMLVRRARAAQRPVAERAYAALAEALAPAVTNSTRKQLRALASIEALVVAQVPGAKEFFATRAASSIALLGDSANVQLQTKAPKVLTLLLKPTTPMVDAVVATSLASDASVPPVRPLVDLLDDGSKDAVPALEVASPAGMFSGLETTSHHTTVAATAAPQQQQQPPPPKPSSSSLIDLLDQPSVVPAVKQPQQQPDLLAGLEVASAPVAEAFALDFLAPTPTSQKSAIPALDALTATPAPATTTPSAFPFLSDLAPAPAAPTRQQPTTSAFPFLESDTTKHEPLSVPSSAFPFTATSSASSLL